MNALERELFTRRASGILPRIDIAGTDFTIDWRLRELRETAAPWNRIDLRDMETNDAGDQFYFLYDTEAHQEFHFNRSVIELPTNVVFASIPYELQLDPYAAGRDYTSDLESFVKQFPIIQNLSAKISPLSETKMAELIEQNILLLSQNDKFEPENPANIKSRGRGR